MKCKVCGSQLKVFCPVCSITKVSDTQLKIIKLIAKGYINAEIAKELNRSEQTVKNHVSSALAKTGARNRVQLTLLLVEKKI